MNKRQIKKNIQEFIFTIGFIILLLIATYYYGYQDPQTQNQKSEGRNEVIQEASQSDRLGAKTISSISSFIKDIGSGRRVITKPTREVKQNNQKESKGNGKEVGRVILGKGLAVGNNNPCNLRFTGKYIQSDLNAVRGSKGFARFNSPEDGLKACEWQVNQYRISVKGYTVSSYAHAYAPENENDTNGYIKFLTDRLNVNQSTKLSTINLDELVKAVMFKESNSIIK